MHCPNPFFLVLVSLCCCEKNLATPLASVYEKIGNITIFSKFYTLLQIDLPSKESLLHSEVTVFAPTNQAFRKFSGDLTRTLPSYHVAKGAYLRWTFDRSHLYSILEENPPLWVTKRDFSVYINNALVLERDNPKSYVSINGHNQTQILYSIDEVLDPVIPNPTAYDVLSQTHLWTERYTTETFLSGVRDNRLEQFFSTAAAHTFFLPVDDADFTNRSLNLHTIKAHVVPGMVLFTRPAEKEDWHQTLAKGDYQSVYVYLFKVNRTYFVKSEVLKDDAGNETGKAISKIVLANVPLKNGVAHLVSKPLAVFGNALTSQPSLQVVDKFSVDPDLNTSYYMGVHSAFNEHFNLPSKFTFFVPSNAAWANLKDKFFLRTVMQPAHRYLARKILERHLVVGDVPIMLETLEKVTENRTCVRLATPGEKVCLGARKIGADYVVTWNGKDVGVARANFECLDGIVHIMDDAFVADYDFSNFGRRNSVDFVKMWKTLKDLF